MTRDFDPLDVKAMVFDTFGTVVDWRGSIVAEGERYWGPVKGMKVDWAAFADSWRSKYGPSMNRVRTGELPWMKLDDLHRMALDACLEEFGVTHLSEEDKQHLNSRVAPAECLAGRAFGAGETEEPVRDLAAFEREPVAVDGDGEVRGAALGLRAGLGCVPAFQAGPGDVPGRGRDPGTGAGAGNDDGGSHRRPGVGAKGGAADGVRAPAPRAAYGGSDASGG